VIQFEVRTTVVMTKRVAVCHLRIGKRNARGDHDGTGYYTRARPLRTHYNNDYMLLWEGLGVSQPICDWFAQPGLRKVGQANRCL